MRIWIKDFSSIARPLVDLTRKDTDFVWQDEHDRAMEQLKSAIICIPSPHPHRLQVRAQGLPRC
jgi:hypothetical protein